MSKIYLATSWKNEHYTRILELLRDQGHEVYDFREKGFLFSQCVPEGVDHTKLPAADQFRLLDHPLAKTAIGLDKNGLDWADILVMLYPCGNDAHVELGYAAGQGKYTVVYINEGYTVGLMDLVADKFVFSDDALVEAL